VTVMANFDVFVMPATGGTPTRLTYHSSPDYPTDFTTDNQQVLFTSSRNIPEKKCALLQPAFIFKTFYSVFFKRRQTCFNIFCWF
jgi:hypothetical protein